MKRWLLLLILTAGTGVVCAPARGQAQVVWRDLVLSGGVSAEDYQGNLSAVTVSAVDSTEDASAAVGEFGVRGDVLLFESRESGRSLAATFDGGLRQFAAAGFELRDYAPREWVGSLALDLRQEVSDWGTLQAALRGKGRRVEDRPPMPLFLQPGYGSVSGALRLFTVPVRGVSLDAEVFGEFTDYRSRELTPQLDLLDRRAGGFEVGATWGPSWTVRFYSGFEVSRYPQQGSFDPDDPFRRDRTVRTGVEWRATSPVLIQLGVEGVVNRSNSARPEYDAFSVEALLSTPLPAQFGLNLYAVVTGKSYLRESEFARLVPGEEADNASQAFLSVDRSLAANLDGALRLGWTRAETDIGNSYYQRFGVSFLLHYRPGLP